MPWLSQSDTDAELKKLKSTDIILDLFAASQFVDDAFYPEHFVPGEEWARSIQLSEEGRSIASELGEKGVLDSPQLACFTLFRIFSWHGILVNLDRTDPDDVMSCLSKLMDQQAKWPYVFGHLLYDKFNSTDRGNHTDFLNPNTAQILLEGTPQGVFQVGNLVSGPLGVLKSKELRFIPPSLKLPLWHCSDPGCQALHLMEAQKYDARPTIAFRETSRFLTDTRGRRSEWFTVLRRAARGKFHPSGRPYVDLPGAIADCIIGEERTRLLARILSSSDGTELRSFVLRIRGLSGSSEQIASCLSPEEQHQLVLLLQDRTIVQYLDELIRTRRIDIPPSEGRKVRTYAPRSRGDWLTEMSSLGVKSSKHPPLIHMYAQIWNTYEKLGLLEDLAWRIQYTPESAPTAKHALMDYLRKTGPETALFELVLSSRAVTVAVGENVFFNVQDGEEKSGACKRLLWKLGFRVRRYGEEYEVFRKRIAEFKTVAIRMPAKPNEDDRAKVRSVGVNLFVSVEAFLEELIAFNVWMLASDHFLGTRLGYTKQDAMRAVAKTLGNQITSGGETLSWRTDGTNPLGVLLTYFAAFRNWINGRRDSDKIPIQRKLEDYPFFAEDPLWVFPYKHTELWADVPADVLANYERLIDEIYKQAVQANLLKIRNGLDHKREEGDFPEADSMLACASRLEQLFELSDARSIIPKILWAVKLEQSLDGSIVRTGEDYKGASYLLRGPSPVAGMDDDVSDLNAPFILAPFDFLGVPNSILSFSPQPMSLYKEYWSDYPRRRFISARESPGDQTSSSET